MNHLVLTYLGCVLPIGWGLAHLFATGSALRSFGDLSTDNLRIMRMEWITEGVALVFTGSLVAVATYIDHSSPITRVVCWMSFGVLNILSVVSIFTGFRHTFIVYKLCPFIFTGSSILILIGSCIR